MLRGQGSVNTLIILIAETLENNICSASCCTVQMTEDLAVNTDNLQHSFLLTFKPVLWLSIILLTGSQKSSFSFSPIWSLLNHLSW